MQEIECMQLVFPFEGNYSWFKLIGWREKFIGQNSENKKLKAINSGISFIVKFT